MAKNRILIVEDEKAISDGIAVNLQYSGYEYKVFADGKEAADSLEDDHSYDLALLDIMLPGIDGFELLSYMKQYNIPVIYLTAKSDTSSEIKGLRDGAEDYIVKPFDMLTLLVRIEKVLERNGKLNQILRIGDITLDLENHIVTKGGQEVILKPLEFEVFAMLARYKNCTILREKLLNEIWGSDFFGDTHTIDVHISNLRKKLDASDIIKTVPKYGYRLEDK
ncbi:MAG TPA: response regulator transcription factor [Acetivibrio clariflavus]|nr:response regulator transcription factor [Acetivibrio clariflavus]